MIASDVAPTGRKGVSLSEGFDVLLLDLDDTLYDYAPAERAARDLTIGRLARDFSLSPQDALENWILARGAVKARLGARASAHSRVLYLAEFVHRMGRPSALRDVRRYDDLFWSAFLRVARLRPSAMRLVVGFRARGGKVAIVTDLTLSTQLRKLEAFGLCEHVDAVVASEEVPADKPAPEGFLLALARLGHRPESDGAHPRCLVVGDDAEKDGEGARRIGLPYFHITASEDLERLADGLCLP